MRPIHAGANGSTNSAGDSFGVERASALPDGIVTFLMTDVVESTPLWLRSRSQMYVAMKRHDQLLTSAISASGGAGMQKRGAGRRLFAAFLHCPGAPLAAGGSRTRPPARKFQPAVRGTVPDG